MHLEKNIINDLHNEISMHSFQDIKNQTWSIVELIIIFYFILIFLVLTHLKNS